MADDPKIPSPCVGVCAIDPAAQLCVGCFRSISEITAWRDASASEQHAVLARLPLRRAAYEALHKDRKPAATTERR